MIEDVQTARDKMRVGDRAAAAAAAERAAATAMARPIETDNGAREPDAQRLSDGVGPMREADAPAVGSLEFNPDARSASYVFRAGSVLPDDHIAQLEKRIVLLRHGDELFALDPERLAQDFGTRAFDPHQPGTTLVADADLKVLSGVSKGAVPELLRSVGGYNVVQFDGYYYGVPQSLGAVDWGKTDLSGNPAVFISRSLRDVVHRTERTQDIPPRSERLRKRATQQASDIATPLIQITPPAPSRPLPHLVATVDTYNVVEFEGWFYGLPHVLGPIDLLTTDVIEMPGVIRDLSRDVVEGEIRLAARG